MFEQRSLIQYIPAGKFHSALMTSYSINLYYWEVQLLRTLSGKGINFVSALVDADCLSDQLLKFSKAFSGKRELEFSIHGYKSKGAFHPKIQFYAGDANILVLIGSGNLTISGHGKNMEVWTPVMVDSADSRAYRFIRDVWNYLSSLYNELGNEARRIVKAIEDNCPLLRLEYKSSNAEHQIDSDYSIRLFTDGSTTLFQQCKEWIDKENEKIKSITVMSPFYDSGAELMKAFYRSYNPKVINIIVEKGFGAAPKPQALPDYVKIYSWEKAAPDGKQWQDFFHSKCFFFEGERHNYMICGSANASVAAFGIPGVPSTNREASVGYKSASKNFLAESGLRLIDPISSSEIKHDMIVANDNSCSTPTVWIMEAAYDYGSYTVKAQNDIDIQGAFITFYSGDRKTLAKKPYSSLKGEHIINGSFNETFYPLYCEVTNKEGELISNRQFAISIVSMDYNNPSPNITSYRKSCRAIESGQFVNGSVLRFIEEVLSDNESKISAKSAKSAVGTLSSEKPKDIQGGHFTSYEDYIKADETSITGDQRSRKTSTSFSQSTLLFDSMISYITKSAKQKENEDIDDEETEDFNLSEGRDTSTRSAHTSLKTKSAEDVKKRVIRMLNKYVKKLEPIAINGDKPTTISMIETLKKFMTAIFFLNRTLGYRYVTEEAPEKTLSLFDITYSIDNHETATEFIHRIINLFALYVKNCKVQEESNKVINSKIKGYKQYAFELCISTLAICEWMNEGNKSYHDVVNSTLSATLCNIQLALDCDFTKIKTTDIFRRIDKSTQELEGFDISIMDGIINRLLSLLVNAKHDDSILLTDKFGYVTLHRHPEHNKAAFICTMASEYDNKRKIHCPGYMFIHESRKMLHIIDTKEK